VLDLSCKTSWSEVDVIKDSDEGGRLVYKRNGLRCGGRVY